MEVVMMMIDGGSSARFVLADVSRAFRSIVDDVFGWRHDGRLKLPKWRPSVPQDFAWAVSRLAPA